MTLNECVPIDEAVEWLRDTVPTVLDTMFCLPAEPVALEVAAANCDRHIAGSVGFGGMVNGVVYIFATDAFGRELTKGMLGLSDQEIENDKIVDEVIAELANMSAGGVKSRLCDLGAKCVLSLPTIVRGTSITVCGAKPSESRSIAFKCKEHYFVVELLTRTDAQKKS